VVGCGWWVVEGFGCELKLVKKKRIVNIFNGNKTQHQRVENSKEN
jgi:hypothetical protein